MERILDRLNRIFFLERVATLQQIAKGDWLSGLKLLLIRLDTLKFTMFYDNPTLPNQVRGLNDVSRGLNDVNRGLNDVLRGPNDILRGPNDVLRGLNDVLRGLNDVLRGPNDVILTHKRPFLIYNSDARVYDREVILENLE